MSTFDLTQEEINIMEGTLNQPGQTIQLPFAAPAMWWKNGEVSLAKIAEIKDARRFGGFGISKESSTGNTGTDDMNLPELPHNWQLFTDLVNRESKTYSAYLARTAWVARIARRYLWKTDERTGRSKSNVNYLCYLATADTKTGVLSPWGAVVLTGSSYSGKAIDDAFAEFDKLSKELRGVAPGNYFYVPLGTFGGEPKFSARQAKEGGASSQITPCQLFIGDGITQEGLESCFVSNDIRAEMVVLKLQAQEWLDDWNKKKSDKPATRDSRQEGQWDRDGDETDPTSE